MEHTPKPADEIDDLLEGLPIQPANSPQPLQEGPQDAAQARRDLRNLRDAGRIAKAAAATLQNPFAGVPVLPENMEGLAGVFIGGEGRPKLIGRNPEATFYRNGRVVFNPAVVEWLKYVGWRSAELTYPPTHPEGSEDPPTHFWLEKGGNSSPVLREKNGFVTYWQMGMSKRLRRAWPPGQWTTPVECSNDDTRDFPNMDFIRMPTHPKVHLRKSGFAIRPAPVPKEIRRVRKPQAGDVYANFKGKRRYILEAIPAKGDYKGKIVFSENLDGSDPITQTMLTFKAWISIGGRLLTPEETKIDPLDDLL